MIRYFYVVLACLMSCSILSQAQTTRTGLAFEHDWKKADSLKNAGLPQSAEKIVQSILNKAQTMQDKPNEIKAKLNLMLLENEYSETSLIDNIQKAKIEVANSTGVEKAVWQSITASLYWQYYQNNRWQILNRSVLEHTVSEDMATWDAQALFAKASEYYLASVSNGEPLKGIRVEQYLPLIIQGKNTRQLRPTLYDLLLFRAIDFFSDGEKDITNPLYQFEIDDARYFAPAAAFAEMSLTTSDSQSLHWRALQLYQDVIAFHLKDAQPHALIDADLQRLKFVYQNAILENKDSLYYSALRQVAQNHDGVPAVAEALFLIQEYLYEHEDYQNDFSADSSQQDSHHRRISIRQNLQQIMSRYPDSEGAIHAFQLIQQLEEKSLSALTEEVVLPDENLRVLINYRNVGQAYCFLYHSTIDFNRAIELYDNDERKDFKKQISHASLIKSWEVQLPDYEDMYEHHVEINAGKIAKGSYILVVSTMPDPLSSNAVSGFVSFQTSNLSLITDNNQNGLFVLNRKTGQPEKDVQVYFYERKYLRKGNKYSFVEKEHAVTDDKGWLNFPAISKNVYTNYAAVLLVKGEDSLLSREINAPYSNTPTHQKKKQYTFFFTDRAIYRPGQTIYFKGIIVKSNEQTGKSDVVAQKQATVIFYDANGQKIAEQILTTNEFGSFSGTFTAPEGTLNGLMRISSGDGSVYIQVEEYKRPKFYVEFDTLKDNYALNSKVKIKGFAKAYAGNNIDDADIAYRVVRQARFPFYWCYYTWGMPSSPQKEIANGKLQTQPDGSFEIEFNTVPDKQVNPKALPVFTYEIYADVTDKNGETRSGKARLNAGYRSLQISANIPEDAKPNDLDSIAVFTQNLNGIFTSAQITMTIAPLQFPGKFYRKRLWQKPDKHILSENEFRALFPDDEFDNEGDYQNWKALTAIFDTTFNSTANGIVKIPPAIWKNNGWYVITFSTKDAQGNDIVEKKYTHLWNPENNAIVQKPIIVQSNQEVFQPGETAILRLASTFEMPYLLTNSTEADYNFHRYKRPIVFEKIIKEEDRGGIAFAYMFVHNNRVYRTAKTLTIPWDNKDLEISWATNRDKMLPGAEDEWTMTISGHNKEKIAAELLAGMYDASLDAFKPQIWHINKLVPYRTSLNSWREYDFGTAYFSMLRYGPSHPEKDYEKWYDRFIFDHYLLGNSLVIVDGVVASPNSLLLFEADEIESVTVLKNFRNQQLYGSRGVENDAPPATRMEKAANIDPASPEDNLNVILNDSPFSLRKNLQETAFFFPQLLTDNKGNISFRFTMPEALTEWKLMAFAHTKDWKTGYLEGKVKTQKDLMVMPNLPRFLRQGDDVHISTKINSLADHELNGTALIEILNAETLQPLDLPFRLQEKEQQFSIPAHQSTALSWKIHVPESIYTPVIIRIKAKAGNFTDGEENTLAVVTNRMLVTETFPMALRGEEEKTFTLEKLQQVNSNSLVHRSLTVEYTSNPAWYAVLALPYLMEYPYDCAEQTFNRYYANALASHIIAQSPKIKAIFDQWKNEDTAALLSGLAKNQELKSALLEETPWVLEAQSETEQRHRIAQLFETHRLAKTTKGILNQLVQMQLPEGGFPWFMGMKSNRYITQYIITGLARLQQLDLNNADKIIMQHIIDKALPYLDREMKRDYENLVRNKVKLEDPHISYEQVQYLYMRSFYSDAAISKDAQQAFNYYHNQALKYYSRFNPYLKGMLALALNRMNEKNTAQTIMASLRETAVHHEEMGMYWKDMPRGYYWYQAPIEAQALLIEAFHEVAHDNTAIDAMKTWLLKQKQTQYWPSTRATADACYALLLSGSEWLAFEPDVTIQLGDVKTFNFTEIKTTAGTGYFKGIIEGAMVQPAMGTISVKIQDKSTSSVPHSVSWGAVYWQYFEDMDKITSVETPLSLTKQLFIERLTDKGPVLTAINENNPLKIGDKVKVRLVLKSDREMEFVHLKDSRGACFEPLDVLSRYSYQNGVGYYESTKDVSTNFFFDRLPKGTHVLEYAVFVNQKGAFSNGIATVQCMYAPEFSSHTSGVRVQVE